MCCIANIIYVSNKPKSEELSINTKSLLHRHRILGINPSLSFPLSSYHLGASPFRFVKVSLSLSHLKFTEFELITIRNIHI